MNNCKYKLAVIQITVSSNIDPANVLSCRTQPDTEPGCLEADLHSGHNKTAGHTVRSGTKY